MSFKLYCFLNEWHAVRPLRDDESQRLDGLAIDSRDRTELLALILGERVNRFALRALTKTYQAEYGRPVPLRHDADDASRQGHPIHTLVRWREQREDPVDIADLAEACGWLALTPARLRSRGDARLAVSELIPPDYSRISADSPLLA